MPNYSREEAIDTARHWRIIAETRPPFDLDRRPLVVDRHCIRSVKATGWHVVCTRDVGFHAAGFLPERTAERAYHMKLACQDPATGGHGPMDHDAAAFLAEGFFGAELLPFVLVQQQVAEKTAESNPDTWHYLLFVAEDWNSPICGLRPEGYSTWLQHTLALKHLARQAGR